MIANERNFVLAQRFDSFTWWNIYLRYEFFAIEISLENTNVEYISEYISEYIDLENINFRYLIFLSKRIAPTQFIPVFATTLLIQNANISVFSSVRIFPQMLSVYLIILYKQYGC